MNPSKNIVIKSKQENGEKLQIANSTPVRVECVVCKKRIRKSEGRYRHLKGEICQKCYNS